MNEVDTGLFFRMLQRAADEIESQVPYLNQLDSQTGDGDHGTTMLRVCHCVQAALEQQHEDVAKFLDDLGWSIMGQDGGSAGMLIGNFYMGLGDGIASMPLDSSAIAKAFDAGLARLSQFSGAKQGDKTMLDALIPAVDALKAQAELGVDLTQQFTQAARAAQHGAESTKGMVPTRGRAKNMGEKARDFIDPGASSMAIMFAALSHEINQEETQWQTEMEIS